MKILHVIDSGGLYGAEKMLLSLAVECRRLGHEVTIATIVAPQDESDPLGEAARGRGLDHHRFRMNDGLNLRGAGDILRFAEQQGFGIIHTHGYKANILLSLAAGRRRPRLVCTLHGWAAVSCRSRLWFYEALDRLLLRRFDRVVVVSEPMRRVASRHVPGERLEVIPNGIELAEPGDDQAASMRQAPAAGTLRILAIGRLSHEKGFDRLVAATAILVAGGMQPLVTIAGDGECRAALEQQIAAAGLQGQLRLVGYVADVGKLYRESDLFVICSRTEGLPLVLLEAMAHGLPVVATPVGEIPVVLGHGRYGCLLDDDSPQALADGIRRVAGSSDLGELASRASAHVRAEYSAAKMAARYCRVYEDCLGAAAGPGR